MNWWPFKRDVPVEDRGAYTDAIVAQILANAGAALTGSTSTSALEIAAGVVSRAFGAGMVEGNGQAQEIGPRELADIGRDLVTAGESVWVYRSGAWMRGSSWEIAGRGARPSSWRYRVQVAVPDGHVLYTESGERVLHARYSSDRNRPWVGVGPLERCTLAGDLFAHMENRMGQEAGGSVGHLLPIPTDGNDPTVAGLKADVANLGGKTALVETTSAGYGQGRAAAPAADYKPQRIGATFTANTVPVYNAVQLSILAACGVPIELVSESEGTGQREAWRRFLHGTVQPLADVVAAELTRATGARATIGFEALFASDIAGRARAFQSMVGAGLSIGAAAAASGLVSQDG